MTATWFCFLGLCTGLHAASWGAFKDSPYEGFRWGSYVRSIVIGLTMGYALSATPWAVGLDVIVLVGLLYAAERLTTEWWKTFVRHDDQSAYSIPMRLGYRGRPVESRTIRYILGSGVALGLLATSWILSSTESLLPSSSWAAQILVGGLGGWLTACGGAWKDAPIEGFSGWKFMRSPLVATAWAIPLSLLTHDLVVVVLSAGGFAVASVETYKTFLTGGRAPGKFATKVVRFDYPGCRYISAVVHLTLWAGVAMTFAAGG
jgi:hypothetical protein